MTDGRMSISELADRSGLTIPTIKFYIRQGLLAPGTKMNRTRSWYGLDYRVRPRPHAGRTPFDGTEVIDIDLVLGLCQRVDVLDVGRIIASGSPEQIRADPAASRRISGTCRWTSDRTGDRARRSRGRLRWHGRGARSGRASWAPRGDRSAGPERGGQDDDAASDCRAAGADRRAARQRVVEMLPALEPLLQRRARSLSGGEQQMLALARALASRPRCLLVDEMSLGLAPLVIDRLFPILRRIADEDGVGVLLVEQHVRMALAVADRAYVLAHGRLTFEGPAAELANQPDRLRTAYFGQGPGEGRS